MTIVQLRGMLKKSSKTAGRRQRVLNSEEPLEKRVLAALEARGVLKRSDAVFTTFQEMDHWSYFDSHTKPVLVIIVMDDRSVGARPHRS